MNAAPADQHPIRPRGCGHELRDTRWARASERVEHSPRVSEFLLKRDDFRTLLDERGGDDARQTTSAVMIATARRRFIGLTVTHYKTGAAQSVVMWNTALSGAERRSLFCDVDDR